eukprot:6118081-Pyramimonas_sp.AAC.1
MGAPGLHSRHGGGLGQKPSDTGHPWAHARSFGVKNRSSAARHAFAKPDPASLSTRRPREE